VTGDGRPERVVLDASVLLGGGLPEFVAAAALGFCKPYWSSWIVGEVVRKRTEWIARRALRDGVDLTELRRRLLISRHRINALVEQLSSVFHSVDYAEAPDVDLTWLADRDDWPVMKTALAAEADILVTENRMDFPLGQRRHGILLQDSNGFLARLYTLFPEAAAEVADYLRRDQSGR
jgi:predicted nucleic acid-binding protein